MHTSKNRELSQALYDMAAAMTPRNPQRESLLRESAARLDEQTVEIRRLRELLRAMVSPTDSEQARAQAERFLSHQRDDLLAELERAHTIIRNAMAVMSLPAKTQWGAMNERDGVAGEGITRANERLHLMARSRAVAA